MSVIVAGLTVISMILNTIICNSSGIYVYIYFVFCISGIEFNLINLAAVFPIPISFGEKMS